MPVLTHRMELSHNKKGEDKMTLLGIYVIGVVVTAAVGEYMECEARESVSASIIWPFTWLVMIGTGIGMVARGLEKKMRGR